MSNTSQYTRSLTAWLEGVLPAPDQVDPEIVAMYGPNPARHLAPIIAEYLGTNPFYFVPDTEYLNIRDPTKNIIMNVVMLWIFMMVSFMNNKGKVAIQLSQHVFHKMINKLLHHVMHHQSLVMGIHMNYTFVNYIKHTFNLLKIIHYVIYHHYTTK
eukprot:UN03028